MAIPCCRLEAGSARCAKLNATGLPLLAMPPNRTLPTDVDLESFADLVDRSLADVRDVLVLEHTKRLLSSTSAATNRTGKSARGDLLSASQLSTWELTPQQPHSANAVANLVIECGTQTQVDWSLPVIPFTFPPAVEQSQAVASVSLDASASDKFALQKEQNEQKETKRFDRVAIRGFGSIYSEDLKARNEQHANQIAQQVNVSLWQRMLKRSKKAPMEMFEAMMACVIFANAIAISASCDTKDWEQGWFIVDTGFAVIFIIELLIKMYTFGLAKYFCGADCHWAWFELSLVALSIFEFATTFMMFDAASMEWATLLRVVRLVRLVKLVRVCRVPMASDLVMMVTGIVGGCRTLISALFLVCFPLFVFALVMRETLGEEYAEAVGTGAQSFDTLPKACFTTFRCIVAEDCGDDEGWPIFVLASDEYGWCYGAIYTLTLLVLKFGLFNVIIAIFVEQTVQAAKYNATYQKRTRLNDQMMFQEKSLELAELAYSMKQDVEQETASCNLTMEEMQSLELSKNEFYELCRHAEFKELLTALDVAEEDHLDLFDTLDVDGGGTLDLGEIVSGIAKLRGDARKSDIVAVILIARHLNKNLAEFKKESDRKFEQQNRQLSAIQKTLQPIFNTNPRVTGGAFSEGGVSDNAAVRPSSVTFAGASNNAEVRISERMSLVSR